MIEEVRTLLYDYDNGLISSIRNQDPFIEQQEKELLLNFSRKINEDLKNKSCNTQEVLLAFDIIHSLMLMDELKTLATEFVQNIFEGFEIED